MKKKCIEELKLSAKAAQKEGTSERGDTLEVSGKISNQQYKLYFIYLVLDK